MQSMYLFVQGVGYTYNMDVGFVYLCYGFSIRGSRGKRKRRLESMGWKAGHTISHVYTTYFKLEISEVCEGCTFWHRVWFNTYDMDLGFVVLGVSANWHW